MKQKTKQFGFTLIEILVVVAIICLLTAAILVSVKTARLKARDSKRSQDIHNIMNALAVVYDKYGGSLPCRAFSDSKTNGFMDFLINEGVIAASPKDPLNDANYYYHFITFKSSASAACGTGGGVLGFYMETPGITSCPENAYFAGSGHCHLFYPDLFTSPCNSSTYYANEVACSLVDTVNQDPSPSPTPPSPSPSPGPTPPPTPPPGPTPPTPPPTPPPPDTTPPTVSITAPSNGATVSGNSVTVSATASDDVAVVGVQFKLDGANLGAEDTTSPYSISWDSTTATFGSHSLTAVARDAVPNTTTSSAVSVTVSNTTTVTFDALAIGNLNNQSPSGVIDWGTTAWAISGAYGGFNTRNLGYRTGSITSGSFTFVSAKHLASIQATSTGTAGTVTLSCAGNSNVVTNVPSNGSIVTITTNWANTCTSVTIAATNGWDTNFDNLVYY